MLSAREVINALVGQRLDVGVAVGRGVDQRRRAAPVFVARVGVEDFRKMRLVSEQAIGEARLGIALGAAAERVEVGRIEERGEAVSVP